MELFVSYIRENGGGKECKSFAYFLTPSTDGSSSAAWIQKDDDDNNTNKNSLLKLKSHVA